MSAGVAPHLFENGIDQHRLADALSPNR